MVCCYPYLHPAASHASGPAGGSIWAVDVPTWITAVATADLLIGAIITALYATRAFAKQSQEASDRADMLQVQSEQLDEQRKINAEQTRVLVLQAEELEKSLDQRKREAEERRAGQASLVFVWQERTDVHAIGKQTEHTRRPRRTALTRSICRTSCMPRSTEAACR